MQPRLEGTGTRCNLTHCGWVAGGEPRLAVVDPLAWRRNVRELRVRTAAAGPCKGLGVFATQSAGPGRFVAEYVGELLNLSQLLTRYAGEEPVYVYKLDRSFSIDARDSTHFSRYINHDARPNLHASISKERRRIDFFTVRPVSVGDELTIDYGVSYWRRRAHVPDEGSEPRLPSDGRRLPTCLPPDAPISAAEASAALSRRSDDSAAAFWRTRSRARGLASPHELAALPVASSARAAGGLLRALLRRMFVAPASVGGVDAAAAAAGAIGGGEPLNVAGSRRPPRVAAGAWWPSESDARLAWRARSHLAALVVRPKPAVWAGRTHTLHVAFTALFGG